MTNADVDTIASVIVEVIVEALKPLKERIAALEGQKTIATLDAAVEKHSSSFKGPWSQQTHYLSGDIVTHGGRVWHANKPTYSRPGSDGSFTSGPVKTPVRMIGR